MKKHLKNLAKNTDPERLGAVPNGTQLNNSKASFLLMENYKFYINWLKNSKAKEINNLSIIEDKWGKLFKFTVKSTGTTHEVEFEMNIGLGNSPKESKSNYGFISNNNIVANYSMKLNNIVYKKYIEKYLNYGKLTSKEIFDYFIEEVNKPKILRRKSNWATFIFFDHENLMYLYDDCIIEKKELDILMKEEKIIYSGHRLHQGDFLKSWKLLKPKKVSVLKDRFLIFKRDKYRCKICGRSAKDGIKLELDHIIPKSKNGINDISNYQTLCRDCNNGKSNLDL
jgi:hypothetical protein